MALTFQPRSLNWATAPNLRSKGTFRHITHIADPVTAQSSRGELLGGPMHAHRIVLPGRRGKSGRGVRNRATAATTGGAPAPASGSTGTCSGGSGTRNGGFVLQGVVPAPEKPANNDILEYKAVSANPKTPRVVTGETGVAMVRSDWRCDGPDACCDGPDGIKALAADAPVALMIHVE